jgi:hypothetical protein
MMSRRNERDFCIALRLEAGTAYFVEHVIMVSVYCSIFR